MSAMGIVSALAVRELVRLSRQPARVVGAIGAPALAWVLLGAGFAGSFAPPGEEAGAYGRYLVPGIASLTVLFSAIFAAISLIEDRDLGVLRAVAAGPAPGWAIALGKVVGASMVAVAQGAVVMLAGLLVGLPPGGVAAGALCLVPLSFGIAGVSLAAGWRCGSVSGFHSVMNLVLMPAWLLSGAAFPLEGSAGWMAWIMRLNPLTYATGALRSASEGTMPSTADLVGVIALGLTGPLVAAWSVRRGRRSF
ncbi:MAG: ABC transporter permease [Planctomycetota bacterium]